MDPVTGAAASRPPARAGGSLAIIGAVLAGVALLVGILCAVQVVSGASRTFLSALTGPVYSTPVNRDIQMTTGRYLVYERTGTTFNDGGGFNDHAVTLTPAMVTVTGPDGQRVPTSESSGVAQTFTRGNSTYTGAVQFDVPADGRYRVLVDVLPPTEVIVGPSLGTGLGREIGWAVGGVISLVVFLVGVVLFVLGLVRRARPARAAHEVPAAGAGPGAGWYPDPQSPGRMRYWDGSSWTGYTH